MRRNIVIGKTKNYYLTHSDWSLFAGVRRESSACAFCCPRCNVCCRHRHQPCINTEWQSSKGDDESDLVSTKSGRRSNRRLGEVRGLAQLTCKIRSAFVLSRRGFCLVCGFVPPPRLRKRSIRLSRTRFGRLKRTWSSPLKLPDCHSPSGRRLNSPLLSASQGVPSRLTIVATLPSHTIFGVVMTRHVTVMTPTS